MALFKKKQSAPVPAPNQEPTVSISEQQEFIQAKSFRGFKRFQIRSSYARLEIEKNLDYLKTLNYDFDGKMVSILLGTHSELGECILVLIGGLLVGSLFNSNKYAEMFDALKQHRIDKAHLRVEDTEYGQGVYLFLHW